MFYTSHSASSILILFAYLTAGRAVHAPQSWSCSFICALLHALAWTWIERRKDRDHVAIYHIWPPWLAPVRTS